MCNFGNFSAHLPCDKRKLYSQFKVCTLVVVFASIRNANSRYADVLLRCYSTGLVVGTAASYTRFDVRLGLL